MHKMHPDTDDAVCFCIVFFFENLLDVQSGWCLYTKHNNLQFLRKMINLKNTPTFNNTTAGYIKTEKAWQSVTSPHYATGN